MGLIRFTPLLAGFLSLVSAQTPSGFIPEIDNPLTIMYDNSSVSAGQQLPQLCMLNFEVLILEFIANSNQLCHQNQQYSLIRHFWIT